ncbi:DUF3164 family protein [Hoeflea sp.]|uniref:DUF3164 family protein n=1 Tax=Hoeflea sp. TaxID=1940281 RepID=UPI003A913D21
MNTEATLEERPEEGITYVNGKPCMADAQGRWTPLEMIKPADKLEDEVVRKIMAFAASLSAQVARFRGHTMTDLGEFDALLDQEYGVKKGGKKGNRTYQTYDGLMKVSVAVAEFVDFGPQLQVAKTLVDECLNEWAADSGPEIRAIVTRAFNTDKEGQINRSEIFMLLRLQIDDARWLKAMDAILDAMRVTGSKEYVRFHIRERVTDPWQAVTIDLAKAGA